MALYAEFVLSAARPNQFPGDNLPEVALVGRSNVGKSSLINSLTRMQKLARTSNTPGRTQTLNFYRIWPEGKPRLNTPQVSEGEERFTLRGAALDAARAGHAFYFVDMPGYGFAKVSETQRQGWRKLIEHYLTNRPNMAAVIQIVDLRHPPTADDISMWEWLRYYGKRRLCVATKADKIPKSQRIAHLQRAARELQLPGVVAPNPQALGGPESEPILLFSSEEGVGRDELWPWLLALTRTYE
ncbi:MAG: GTP-binding protein [Mycobacterium leprae]